MPFRHSTCNEAFENWPFAEACRAIRRAGYTGIEIAPFTLAETPAEITPAQRAEYRSMMASEGLEFVGLHWIMMSPKGLNVSGPDAALRARSWKHIDDLIDLCADLGPNGVLVFGSPNQRKSSGGLTREQATRNYVEGLKTVASHSADRGVRLLVEALPINQSDVVQTLAEAVSIVEEIGSPGIRSMFDVHNAVDETEAHDALIERFFPYIEHVHVNELDGKHCGAGDYDFRPIFAALGRLDYRGWVSLEAFDFTPGAERLVTESLRHLENQISRI
ncbi:MAG: sugar phosphate isomerase/epimerase family protein [Candidatus Solibacter sp.]